MKFHFELAVLMKKVGEGVLLHLFSMMVHLNLVYYYWKVVVVVHYLLFSMKVH